MARELAGYAHLIERYQLLTRPQGVIAVIDSAVRGRHTADQHGTQFLEFQPTYRPQATLFGHLQFALRYEGINLEVLALLFKKTGPAEIEKAIADKPESVFARRLGYLYEWLTEEKINASVAQRAAYIPVVDKSHQFGLSEGNRNGKFRVIDNLPGNRRFCPMVRRTPAIEGMIQKDLKRRTHETISKYDPDLLRRAAAFLYLKETHSSFEVEREKPSADRAKRFADLLRDAESGTPLSDERFVKLQNAIVDPRFVEFSYRTAQVWVGQDLGYRKKVDFVPPRPEDVPDLMHGLVDFSETIRTNPGKVDPVIAAASLAFGFVFIHPFMDGNGRLHRFLIHDVLSNSGFTPKGIVLPVSAVILANLDQYVSALESFSKPLQALTKYDPDGNAPAKGNEALYFRYFDGTAQASFLYWALDRTITHDLEQEISFLLGFDKAHRVLKGTLDWPGHSLDLFIRLVHQNAGHLSKVKRQSHFAWMTEDELKHSEALVREAFDIHDT